MHTCLYIHLCVGVPLSLSGYIYIYIIYTYIYDGFMTGFEPPSLAPDHYNGMWYVSP